MTWPRHKHRDGWVDLDQIASWYDRHNRLMHKYMCPVCGKTYVC
jgi:hypothetical protein